MPTPARIRIISSLKEIDPAAWNRLAHGPSKINDLRTIADSEQRPREAPESPSQATDSMCESTNPPSQFADSIPHDDIRNPFISHAFLSSLEESGSVGGRTGWTPLHLLAEDDSGTLHGALPAYAKSHSRGEYVFDHAFAEAYTRAGGRYYPKLQISVPFTPATGRRLLVPEGPESPVTRRSLIEGLEGLRQRLDASSVHATFLTPHDAEDFRGSGFLERNDQQFHFTNGGYTDFEAFLQGLRADKRKVLRRERRDALANGISVEWLTGKAITEAHWDQFFAFYMDTGSRKWGSPYLNRLFFSLIGERMADDSLLMLAKRDGRYIAGALNFIGADTLYGRHWGCLEHHPFLHFELCYYQAIDFALAKGLRRVEAGAQGEHKLVRGYAPVKTVSMHRFADAGFQSAVADYLKRERAAVDRAQGELVEMLPFRRV